MKRYALDIGKQMWYFRISVRSGCSHRTQSNDLILMLAVNRHCDEYLVANFSFQMSLSLSCYFQTRDKEQSQWKTYLSTAWKKLNCKIIVKIDK